MSTAARGAHRDLDVWRRMLDQAERLMVDAREVDVTGFDPLSDLARRGRWWNHRFPSDHLVDVFAFGIALAQVEVDAWTSDDPVVATRAFEDRRFLFSDRIVHWVVPLTFVVAGSKDIRSDLLDLGDRLRPAPLLTGDEGVHPPGEDSFGPLSLVLGVELGPSLRWSQLAAEHPGTARLWRDLSRRAAASR